MDIHTLRVFVAVAETGSFSQAGERLFLTQPAVSKRIAALESELDARLFDRIGRQVHLTEAGAALLPRARGLLEEVKDIRRSLHNLAGSVGGTLVMGTSHHIGLHRLPPVLRDYSRRYPRVQLDIRFQDSESACREVERGALELAVVTLPPGPLPGLRIETLWADPLCVLVGRDHPLAARPRADLAELLQHPAVLPSEATYTRAILQQALHARDLSLRVGMTTNYLETLKMLAVTGLGWTLLPRTMLDPELVELAVPELRLTRRLGLVMHQRRTLSNAAAAMREVCRAHAGAAACSG